MGTVVVLDQDTVMGLIESLVANASVDGTGQLVLTKQDGSTVVVGYVTDHGHLLGLSDDDHPQYAKADGTRGSFATTTQGGKADTAMSIIPGTIVNGSINGTGQLILTKQDASTVNVGYVADHGNQFGLADDDHTQYAKADGTRGSFATVAQGTKADNARPNHQAAVSITDATNDYVERITITNDASDTANWVNRREVKYKDNSGATARNVFVENEYGEVRLASAKHNTVPFRVFIEEHAANTTGARDNTVPLIQIMDNRDNRNNIWNVLPTGKQVYKDVPLAYSIVLGPSDTVPANTPANTIIVRTT